MLNHLRQTQRGITGGRRGQVPIADGVNGGEGGAGMFGQAAGTRLGDEREKFPCSSERTGRFPSGAGDERIAHKAWVASVEVFPDPLFLPLVALDVSERGQANDGRMRRVGHRGTQSW